MTTTIQNGDVRLTLHPGAESAPATEAAPNAPFTAEVDARPALTVEQRLRFMPPRRLRPAAGDAFELREIADRVAVLTDSNERLSHELARCYDHLGAMFELTEEVATLADPAEIRDKLLHRLAVVLDATLVLSIAPLTLLGEVECSPTAAQVRRLTDFTRPILDQAKAAGRSRILTPCEIGGTTESIGGVLFAPLRVGQGTCEVIIALRGSAQRAFDDGDRRVADSLLAYGGQILSSAILREQIERSALEAVSAFATVIEARDAFTSGHSERVALLAVMTATELGLSPREIRDIEWAGRLHDVGKLGVSERILNKPGKLTPIERAQVEQHPRLSFEMLRHISSLGENLLATVLHHHENFDGSGYPDRLAGDEIPLGARILRVVDVFDALTSTRPYRDQMSVRDALIAVALDAGKGIDTVVARAFIRAFKRAAARPTLAFRREFLHLFETPETRP